MPMELPDSSGWDPLAALPTPLATTLLVAVPATTMLLGSMIVSAMIQPLGHVHMHVHMGGMRVHAPRHY